jgi:fluoride exporter
VRQMALLLVGGALGTLCRYYLGVWLYSFVERPEFPYATVFINVTGSFLIGLLTEGFETRVTVPSEMRVALIAGVLGGYTTFSSFSLETLTLVREGRLELALLNAAGSVVLGLIAVWLGMRLAQTM